MLRFVRSALLFAFLIARAATRAQSRRGAGEHVVLTSPVVARLLLRVALTS